MKWGQTVKVVRVDEDQRRIENYEPGKRPHPARTFSPGDEHASSSFYGIEEEREGCGTVLALALGMGLIGLFWGLARCLPMMT